MDDKNKNERNDLLDHVERGVDALVQLTAGLREENKSLMQRQKNTVDTRATDKKIRNARAKIEALITQLKALEQ